MNMQKHNTMKTTRIYILIALMLICVSGCKNGQKEYNYVDLGLPSGTLWATCNVGADNPEDYGLYFAWGEVESKDTYNWSNYKYCDIELTKYCNDSNCGYQGYIDKLSELENKDDAATVNWGKEWHTPTTIECDELIKNCKQEWTRVNGVAGLCYTGPNGNSIFFPAAGFYDGDNLDEDAGTYGYYWLNSYREDMPYDANSLGFFMGYSCIGSNFQRYYGLPVRPVRSTK